MFRLRSQRQPGAEIAFVCPKCGAATTGEPWEQVDGVSLFVLIPILRLRNTFVRCGSCRTKLRSVVRLGELEHASAQELRDYLVHDVSDVFQWLAVVGLALFWAPLVGLAVAALATAGTIRKAGWPRKIALAGLALSALVSATFGVLLWQGVVASRTPKPVTPVSAPPTYRPLDELLHAIRTTSGSERRRALRELGDTPVDESRRSEVADAIVPVLSEPDDRGMAVAALGVWYTPRALPEMIKVLDDDDFSVRAQAFDALAAVKTKAAAEAVVERLGAEKNLDYGARKLIEMGDVAEGPLLDEVDGMDPQAQVFALKVLAKVGTAASLPTVRRLAESGESAVRSEAEQAVEAIQSRL